MAVEDPTDAFLRMFESLDKTDSVEERIVKLGHGRFVDGKLVLVEVLQTLIDNALSTIRRATDDGATPRQAAEALSREAETAGVTRQSTFALYAVFTVDGTGPEADKLYIGETTETTETRWTKHADKRCWILALAIDSTPNGRDDWDTHPLLALPEEHRCKELLVYFEEILQRELKTVGTPYGLNAQYGQGRFGGACDAELWASKFTAFIKFLHANERFPSAGTSEQPERSIGQWVSNQRANRSSLPVHYTKALETLRCWEWLAHASPSPASAKIDELLADATVVESGGMLMPTNRTTLVQNLRSAYLGKGTCTITAEDKRRIEDKLPAIALGPNEARFRHNSTGFAEKYLDSTKTLTYPPNNKAPFYTWMHNVRNGTIALTEGRRAFMIGVGLGKLLETIKPDDARAATARSKKRIRDAANASVSYKSRAARAARKASISSAVEAGPVTQ